MLGLNIVQSSSESLFFTRASIAVYFLGNVGFYKSLLEFRSGLILVYVSSGSDVLTVRNLDWFGYLYFRVVPPYLYPRIDCFQVQIEVWRHRFAMPCRDHHFRPESPTASVVADG